MKDELNGSKIVEFVGLKSKCIHLLMIMTKKSIKQKV